MQKSAFLQLFHVHFFHRIERGVHFVGYVQKSLEITYLFFLICDLHDFDGDQPLFYP